MGWSICRLQANVCGQQGSLQAEKFRELVQLEAKEKWAKRYRTLSSSSGPVTDQTSSIPLCCVCIPLPSLYACVE